MRLSYLKVIAMDNVMRIPFKVSTTTSNFMIGVTAAASAGIYLKRGYINSNVTKLRSLVGDNTITNANLAAASLFVEMWLNNNFFI